MKKPLKPINYLLVAALDKEVAGLEHNENVTKGAHLFSELLRHGYGKSGLLT